MKILVTGCAGHLARTCIPVLLDDNRVSSVTGIDIKPSSIHHPNYREHIIDMRDPLLEKHLSEVDAVIHLAFVVNNGELGARRFDREYIRDVNIAGSKNVFQLAEVQKVKNLIHISSCVVYGMSFDSPQFMEETQPLSARNGFYYSEDKVAVENYLDEFESQHAGLRVVRLRPHIILGQHALPLLKLILQQPFHFMFPDPQPLTQFISEMDVATAIQQSLFKEVSGSFNLATDQVASFYLIHKHLHSLSLPMPFGIARLGHKLAWRYTGRFGDPAWFECTQYPLTISNDKAKQELGWHPTLNLFECLEATV